jgi:D-proline reductase (dithiol) PrdB
MARLNQMPELMRVHLSNLPCPSYKNHPWKSGPPLTQRRVSLISTAGLHLRGDRPFLGMTGDYRVIPGETKASDLVMTHISTNFDRTGYQQDWNVVFPLDRLRELAEEGIIGSLAAYHYSFMGASDPAGMEQEARKLATILQGDRVDAALLVPV